MHYQLGGPEHFKDAPERARVRLKHDDGREFYATDRTLGSDYWYIDGQKLSKSNVPMGGAIYHRTRVVARRSAAAPTPNSMTNPELLAKTQKAEDSKSASKMAENDQVRKTQQVRARKENYTVSKAHCARHDIDYFKTYGCKKCRAEQRANGVEQSAKPLAPDHVWGDRKLPPAVSFCEKHPAVKFSAEGGECWKCVQENTPPIKEKKTLNLKCPTHDKEYAVDSFCPGCKMDADHRARTVARELVEGTKEDKGTSLTIQQVGGKHYDDMTIDVFEFCESNGLGFVESTAIKYIARRKGETRIEDLRKAINCIERLIKHEETGSWGR